MHACVTHIGNLLPIVSQIHACALNFGMYCSGPTRPVRRLSSYLNSRVLQVQEKQALQEQAAVVLQQNEELRVRLANSQEMLQ